MNCEHPICVVLGKGCVIGYAVSEGSGAFGARQPNVPPEWLAEADALLAQVDRDVLRREYEAALARRKLKAVLEQLVKIAEREIWQLRDIKDEPARSARQAQLLSKIENLL